METATGEPVTKLFYFSPGIIQLAENLFEIIDVRGGSFRTDLEGLAIFLCARGDYSIERIKKEVTNCNILTSKDNIKKTIDVLVNDRFLMKGNNEKAINDSYDPQKIIQNCRSPFNKQRAIAIRELEIVIGTACPYRCRGCYADAGMASNNELSIEECKKVLLDAYKLGATSLVITGGEPLLNQYSNKTVQLIKYAKNLGMRTLLLTTGFNFDKCATALKNSGLDEIQFSLHSLNEYMDWYMGKEGAKENTTKAINCAQAAGFKVILNCVVTRKNIDQLNCLLNYANSQKIFGLRFSAIRSVGRGRKNEKDLYLSLEQKRCIFKFVQKNKKKAMIEELGCSFTCDGVFSAPIICDVGLTFAFINSNGEVLMCNNLPLSTGNIREKPFKEIWMYSKAYAPFRKILPINAKCSRCRDREFCISKCVASAYEKFGQLKMEDEPCCK